MTTPVLFLVSILLDELGSSENLGLASRYLAFLGFAFNTQTKRFRNFMDYQRNWLEDTGSDDSHGRALLALRNCIKSFSVYRHSTVWLVGCLNKLMPAILLTTSPRAWAFALYGNS